VPEIGVRIALGATRQRIAGMVLRQALRLAAIGLVFGALGAISLAAVLRGQFVNTRPLGPIALAGLIILFAIVAAAASWLPARRAARIDPIAALRADG
jgi:putative ABC transport system permease protein